MANRNRVLGIGMAAFGLLLAACSSDSTEVTESMPAIQEAKSPMARETAPQVADADFAAFISGTNEFGFDLYRNLAVKPGNLFYSPLSTTSALAMTYAGAKGQTAQQMASVMHSTLDAKVFHASMNKLLITLDSRNIAAHEVQNEGTKSLKLLPVNQAWSQKDYALVPEYLDTLAVNYGAGLNLLDFGKDPNGSRLTINKWVEEKTKSRIKDLIPAGGVDSDTKLVLTNALYFYGSWITPFDKNNTKNADFNGADAKENIPFMYQTQSTGYAEGTGFKMASLPYDGNKLSMVIILPDAGKLAEVRAGISSEWLAKFTGNMATTSVPVSFGLPKFKFTWGTQSFKEPLIALGMTDAFVFGTADFTGIEPKRDLFVGDVFHQAFIAIDESGTEAAAATAVVMKDGSVPDKPKDFTVDRPFIFLIQDVSGAVLFVGEVSNLSSSTAN